MQTRYGGHSPQILDAQQSMAGITKRCRTSSMCCTAQMCNIERLHRQCANANKPGMLSCPLQFAVCSCRGWDCCASVCRRAPAERPPRHLRQTQARGGQRGTAPPSSRGTAPAGCLRAPAVSGPAGSVEGAPAGAPPWHAGRRAPVAEALRQHCCLLLCADVRSLVQSSHGFDMHGAPITDARSATRGCKHRRGRRLELQRTSLAKCCPPCAEPQVGSEQRPHPTR